MISPEKILDNVRILLVEDSLDNQDLLLRFLQLAGAAVEVANNGKEAVERALMSEYDVVLMDIQMPILNGYEATRTLRASRYDKPIIAMTAHTFPDELKMCIDAGCNSHISKPLTRQALVRAVADACGRHRYHDA